MLQLIAKLSRILGRGTTKPAPPIPFRPSARALQAALAHHQAGRLQEAEEMYCQILAADPKNPDAPHLLGVIAQQQGDSVKAVELIKKSLAINPAQPAAYNNLGAACRSLNLLDEAERAFRMSISLQPNFAEAHNNLGIVLQAGNNLGEAENCYRRAISREPVYAEAIGNLGSVLARQDRLDEAEQCCRRALELKAGIAEAWCTLGDVFFRRGQLDDAERHYREALAIDPGNPHVNWNMAMLTLLWGDYERGLIFYEFRFGYIANEKGYKDLAGNVFSARLKALPRWEGEPLSGRRLLVWAEQGFGDGIMAMRYMPLLSQRGAGRVIVFCEQPLERLVRELPGVDEAVPFSQLLSFDTFDLHCPMMSLPYLFGTRLDSIPDEVPYLIVPDTLVSQWRKRLDNIGNLKVGLAWAGRKSIAGRSISLTELEPLRHLPGIQLISLQKGDESRQLHEIGWSILDFMDGCQDFMDTAALVENLDLVISIDTSVAHLAGALGKPVWLLCRFESDWRWGLGREDSPWYPTMRIFRQVEPLKWDDVIRRVVEELRKPDTFMQCK